MDGHIGIGIRTETRIGIGVTTARIRSLIGKHGSELAPVTEEPEFDCTTESVRGDFHDRRVEEQPNQAPIEGSDSDGQMSKFLFVRFGLTSFPLTNPCIS